MSRENPRHSISTYNELLGDYNYNFWKYLRELIDLRKDVIILQDEKQNILNMVTQSKMIQHHTDCIKFASYDIKALPQDFVPGFEKLFNLDNELESNTLLFNKADDYIGDLQDVLNGIDNALKDIAGKTTAAKSNANEYRLKYNGCRAAYCEDYGGVYEEYYDDEYIDKITGEWI